MSRKNLSLDRRTRRFLSRDPAHCCKCAPRLAREVLLWVVCHPCGVHLPMVTTPIESGNLASESRGLHGSLSLTFEEGTSAAWLHDLLKPRINSRIVAAFVSRMHSMISLPLPSMTATEIVAW